MMSRKLIYPAEYFNIIDVPEEGILDAENRQQYLEIGEERLETDNRFKSLLIPESCLHKRIRNLAIEICNFNKSVKRLDLLVVLTGAFMFAADLGRQLFTMGNVEVYFHYIKLSTYNDEIKSAGETSRKVRIAFEPDKILDRDIIIVEDIIDQGFTLNALKEYLLIERKVRSVKICTLLWKNLKSPTPEVIMQRDKLKPEFVGFNVPDVWVAGYGIDAGNDFRYLPFVIDVNEKHYLNP